jgi:hypothetical protein
VSCDADLTNFLRNSLEQSYRLRLFDTHPKKYIRRMMNNNEYDLNQTLVMVWADFIILPPTCFEWLKIQAKQTLGLP